MGKFAKKPPSVIKSVVEIEGTKEHATVWYAKPVCLGRIDLRNNQWFTQSGSRHISSWDALERLIELYELGALEALQPPEPRAIPIPDLIPDVPAPSPTPTPAPTPRVVPQKKEVAPSVSPKKKPKVEKKATGSNTVSMQNMLNDLLKRPDVLAMLAKEAKKKG
jgi:hypothetical protein